VQVCLRNFPAVAAGVHQTAERRETPDQTAYLDRPNG
jgi:hypothetical protein